MPEKPIYTYERVKLYFQGQNNPANRCLLDFTTLESLSLVALMKWAFNHLLGLNSAFTDQPPAAIMGSDRRKIYTSKD